MQIGTRQTATNKQSLEAKALSLLRQATNHPQAMFRAGQWESIEAITQRKERLLVVQRTGWGKSMVYFLATHLLRAQGYGPTLLISPLLALMRNQIEAAARIGIRAETINSSNSDTWENVRQKLLRQEVDILLISPERLANEEFREKWLLPVAEQIGLLVVDEAHCISDWGHDFRPDYRRITRILQALPRNVPALATTATANNRVVRDVEEQLGPHLRTVRGPLARHSLALQNIYLPSQAARLAWLAEQVPTMPGSGIIYTLTIRDANQVAAWLQTEGIDAAAYTGPLDGETRIELEQLLLENRIKALVATTALGMGFDKPDLGFVIHYQRPGSVVHYYQQVGRAGRALDRAYGIMLSGSEDKEITDYFIHTAFPLQAHEQRILEALQGAEDGETLVGLERSVNLGRQQIEKVLKILAMESPAPVVKSGTRWYATPVRYRRDEEKIQNLIDLRVEEQAQMREYLTSRTCLMNFLRAALDDPQTESCGKCSPCRNQPLLPETHAQDRVRRAVAFLRRSELPIKPRRQWPAAAFPNYGWRGNIAAELRMEEGRALCLWGDAGWGELVRQGKQNEGRFADELIAGMADMIKHRWRPDPMPAWVACVSSHHQPRLVQDMAQRLARNLRIPFVHCIEKIRATRPQKEMMNSFQQAHNLDGAFAVSHQKLPRGPVLLVDDMVDSRWTFTVVAALLRQAGAGPVYPVALALSAQGGQ